MQASKQHRHRLTSLLGNILVSEGAGSEGDRPAGEQSFLRAVQATAQAHKQDTQNQPRVFRKQLGGSETTPHGMAAEWSSPPVLQQRRRPPTLAGLWR
jgi:hypothetical protein